MLVAEAKWFAARLAELGDDALYPQLNVGSHTSEFRIREQPWIDRHLFARARANNRKVVHTDIRPNEGVDLVGDLTDPAFLATVRGMKFRSAFCCNLMEHVPTREPIAEAVVAAVEPGGYLLVSVPHIFPYHPDPIDTMYRPTPEEFAKLFPGTTLVRGEKVRCGNLTTYLFGKFFADPDALFRNLFRRRQQVVKQTDAGMSLGGWLPWLVKPFYQCALVLRKDGG